MNADNFLLIGDLRKRKKARVRGLVRMNCPLIGAITFSHIQATVIVERGDEGLRAGEIKTADKEDSKGR